MEYFPLEEKVRGITTIKNEETSDFSFNAVSLSKTSHLRLVLGAS